MSEEEDTEFVLLDLRDKLTFVREARLIGGRDAGLRAWRMVSLPDVFEGREVVIRRASSDPSVDAWLEEAVELCGERSRASDLFSNYVAWAELNSADAVSVKVFARCLESKGFAKKQSNGVWYLGLRIRGGH